MNACVRGCTVRGRHATDCDNPDECRGCELRSAQHGLLCRPCHLRLELMLHDAPVVDAWLTVNMGALGSVAAKEDFERAKGGSDGAPTPLRLAMYDTRQQLRDQLASWVDNLCDSVRDMNGDPLRGPTRHSSEADAAYLTTWLDTIERRDWSGDLWDEMAQTTSDAHAQAPWRPAMRRRPGIPCPDCHACTLVVFGGEDVTSCLSCRLVMSVNGYALWLQELRYREDERKAALA